MTSALEPYSRHFLNCCVYAPRYKVGWLTGAPLAGKTRLARALAAEHGWHYLDYTLDTGYFDMLITTISTYSPDDLIRDLWQWCRACPAAVLICDHLDALLATWSGAQRRVFVARLSQAQDLPCGVMIVTHLLTCRDFTFLRSEVQQTCIHLQE
ncbi:MAG: hypothetical protein HC911_13695 [Chloroflexaceae bacterium]|nr:hypothetical protein [Chloroflexaceae bacterium]